MQAGARIAAAIEILDTILAGRAAEEALTNWARAHRFAGSGDRAALRDLVFTALRCRRSHAALGGSGTGRGLLLGQLAEAGADAAALFTGRDHAPPPLSEAERAALIGPPAPARNVALDCPDWLAPRLEASLGADFAPVMRLLRSRAPVFLRVNAARATRDAAVAALAAEGIAARPHPLASTALEVTGNARRIRAGRAWGAGLVELQDAASQAVVEALPLGDARRVLDYCAGGGGKALAMAARAPRARIVAHDADPGRMSDLPARAARAGVEIIRLGTAGLAAQDRFDLVLCDVPCSGSGAWRRNPEGKWRLDAAMLARLLDTQARILAEAAAFVRPGGALAYATCSLLDEENGQRVRAFLDAHPGWAIAQERRFNPLEGGDGFYLAVLRNMDRTAWTATQDCP